MHHDKTDEAAGTRSARTLVRRSDSQRMKSSSLTLYMVNYLLFFNNNTFIQMIKLPWVKQCQHLSFLSTIAMHETNSDHKNDC